MKNVRSLIGLFIGIIFIILVIMLGDSPETIAPFISPLLMIVIPIVFGLFLSKYFGVRWHLYTIGMLTFIGSQVLHMPFNNLILAPWMNQLGLQAIPGSAQLILISILYGLSAGVFENTTRYIVLRVWLKKARSWSEGLMFGAGHGGVEAIILGGMVLIGFFRVLSLKGVDLSTTLAPDQINVVQNQLEAYWNTPWYIFLMAPIERIWAICLHLCATLLVIRAIKRQNLLWLGAAILLHCTLDAYVVFANTSWGVVITQAGLAVLGAGCLFLIFVLRDAAISTSAEMTPEMAKPLLSYDDLKPSDEVNAEQLDESRFG